MVSKANGTPFIPASAEAFKQAMRLLVGGVCVITVAHGEERTGMTATSVSSLGDDPPSLIVCVNRSSSSAAMLAKTDRFAVNLLHQEQSYIARQFSGFEGCEGAQRFQNATWCELSIGGAPNLMGALASFDCVISALIPHDSHLIMIGNVQAISFAEQTATAPTLAPLAYWQREYRRLQLDS